ncbi:MAG: ABC transporter substrate-binding protein [Lachnospiraceae bacterium]|nr:ABC transporter substrate-binding protein [Lachnospiraceae bacterium]
MKKRYMAGIITGLILSGALAALNVQAEEEPIKISIGADSSVFSAQIRVAEAAGILEEHNIDAEIVTYSYGIDTINGVILNEVQVGEANDYAVCTRAAQSSNLRLVSSILSGQGDSKSLYVNKEEIQTGEDLKGKKLAVASGTVNEFEIAKTLETYGIGKDEVEYLYFSSDAEMLAAFATGDADAVWLSKQYANEANEVEGSRTIADLSDIDQVNIAYLVVDESFANENEKAVEELIVALDEATELINNDPEKAAELLSDDLGIAKDDALKGLGTYNYKIEFKDSDLDHITSVAEWSIENGLIENAYDLRSYVLKDAITNVFPDRIDF